MLLPPLYLQCSEKLPDESGELEMYSVQFVLSVASRRAQDRTERQQNRSSRLDTNAPAYPSPNPPTPASVRSRRLG
jgi:hypothetical protein